MFTVEMAWRSELGQRSSNEDELSCGGSPAGWYAALADGAGGHQRGAEAARLAVRCIEALLRSPPSALTPDELTHAVACAHAEVQRNQAGGDSAAYMHTTLVVLWIDADARHALWAHVGDSRLYRMRRGRVDIVTRDDSVVQRMVSAGLISEEQAREHPHKNQLVAALGIDGEVDPHTVVRPVELHSGDAFLLCSDGWWEAFDPAGLARTLADANSPSDWLDRMQQHIQARQLRRQDNFSAIAVWVGTPHGGPELAPDDTVPLGRRY